MEQARITGHSIPADQIDEGFRHWYEACPCCLSQAYPDVKQALDEERAATSQAYHGQASGVH